MACRDTAGGLQKTRLAAKVAAKVVDTAGTASAPTDVGKAPVIAATTPVALPLQPPPTAMKSGVCPAAFACATQPSSSGLPYSAHLSGLGLGLG